MPPTTFKQLEHAAWLAKAAIYDEVLAALTAQAIAPILDAFGTLRGKHLLDVACGTGHLTSAAARRTRPGAGLETTWNAALSCADHLRLPSGAARPVGTVSGSGGAQLPPLASSLRMN